MTWRENLLPASFRGAPFFIRAADREGGRRVQVFEFPGREKPAAQDLGRRQSTYRLEGVVLGDDYMAARDFLWSRCTEPGPGYPRFAAGALVHPYLGTLEVACVKVGQRESPEFGGAALFDLEFVEAEFNAGDNGTSQPGVLVRSTPPAAGAAAAAATAAAEATSAAALTEATEQLDTQGQPALVQETVAATSKGALGTVAAALGSLDARSNQVRALAAKVAGAFEQASDLATNPAELLVTLVDAVADIRIAAGNALSSLYVYLDLAGFGPPSPFGDGPVATLAGVQGELVASLLRRAAVAGAAEAAIQADWTSRDDADAARARILAALDRERLTAGDGLGLELGRLHQLVVAGVPAPGIDLPSVRRVRVEAMTSSLLLAYEAAGELSGEEALVERNRLADPGFVPPGSVVEVLVRG